MTELEQLKADAASLEADLAIGNERNVALEAAVVAQSIRSDLTRLRSDGARRIRITLPADELELLRPLSVPNPQTCPTCGSQDDRQLNPKRRRCLCPDDWHSIRDDKREFTFEGCGVFTGSARAYSGKS